MTYAKIMKAVGTILVCIANVILAIITSKEVINDISKG